MSAAAASAGAFAAAGERWVFTGTLTFDDATAVLDAASALPLPASGEIDIGGLEHADSAALAVLLALKRRAARDGKRLHFTAMPALVQSLARVYGVEEMIVA